MIDLDEPASYREIDTAQAIDRIFGLPEQIRRAWDIASGLGLPDSHRGARNVVLCGMGGSAIGGDLVRSLTEGAMQVPFAIVRGYDLPGYIGPDSLVILSSYSGSTEEVLSSYDQAVAANARMLAVTAGGRLAEVAHERGFPMVSFEFSGQPREALGYSALLILGVLTRLDYVANIQAAVDETIAVMNGLADEIAPGVPTANNPAKQLALRLHEKLPVIFGGGLLTEVARRWKGQFNENAKNWAVFEQLPELNHNTVVGFPNPGGLHDWLTVLFLSSRLNHPRIALREKTTQELLARHAIASEIIESRGDSALAQLLSTVYFGDLVSYYLAMLNGADPTEIDAINYLKNRLSGVPHREGN